MGNDWGLPKWRQEGRTGPGPAAPKYKSRKDRNAVRKGKRVGKWKGDSNPGGPGGSTRKIQTNQPQGQTSHRAKGKSSSSASPAVLGIAYALFFGLPALCISLFVYVWVNA